MNYFQTLKFGSKKLKLNDINTHILDSELLLSYALNLQREQVLTNLDAKIKKSRFNFFKKLLHRRQKKEPIAYIINKKEFWKNNFYINNDVLIPRPETEIIVEELLKSTNDKSSKKILEIGTGSGCIVISIIKERANFYATAIDISKKALNIAKINAKMHHLINKIKFINIDIDKIEDSKYDFIVSNPPYINKYDLRRLDKSIFSFEPHVALEAGIDGLREIRKIILKSKKLLKINGKLIFEIGNNQYIKIKKILNENGYYINKVIKVSSYPRVLITTKIN